MPHYETISDQVPQHYETIPEVSTDLPHHYEVINDSGIYSKGKPTDLMKYDWYHGNISEEHADMAVRAGGNINTFLVWHSDNKLILSYKARGWTFHDVIHHTPEGYYLEGKEKVFESVLEMIVHYMKFPIWEDQTLAIAADKSEFGTCIRINTKIVTIIILCRATHKDQKCHYKGVQRGNTMFVLNKD